MKFIQFNKFYRLFNIFSINLILISILFLVIKGLNFGVDFIGGTVISNIRDAFGKMNLGDVSVKNFGNENDYIIKFEKKNSNDPNFITEIKDELSKSIGNNFDIRRVENVGPKVSAELLKSGIIAIGLSLEINLSIVAAVLTIVGYSMNDTVVIFDRVRENLKKISDIKIFELTNISINETLSRTIITSATTLLALISIFIFGGEILKGFSFAMILGVIIGTYSSIYIANPILVYLRVNYKTIIKEDKEK